MSFDLYYHQRRLETLQDLFSQFSGVILDLGCGTSLVTEFKPNVIGIDIGSQKNVDWPIKADACNIPIRHGSIDCIYAGEIIEHLENQEAFLHEIRRVLKDNGLLLISTPNISDAYGNHKKMLEYKQFKQQVTTSGFAILKRKGIYCRYFSRTGLYRKVKFRYVKRFLMIIPFPVSISYNVVLLCRKI